MGKLKKKLVSKLPQFLTDLKWSNLWLFGCRGHLQCLPYPLEKMTFCSVKWPKEQYSDTMCDVMVTKAGMTILNAYNFSFCGLISVHLYFMSSCLALSTFKVKTRNPSVVYVICPFSEALCQNWGKLFRMS